MLAMSSTLAWAKPSFGFMKEEPLYQKPSVVQGPTDISSTQFSVVHRKEQKLNYLVEYGKKFRQPPSHSKTYLFETSPYAVTQIFFNNLSYGENFNLNIYEENNILIDTRSFHLIDTNSQNFKFAFGSCMLDILHKPKIWKNLIRQKIDALFLIGDTIYADFDGFSFKPANPEKLWERHVEARLKLFLYESPELTPIFTVWDDHDFGSNDSDRNYPYKEESKNIFNIFFPQADGFIKNYTRGPGVSSYWRACGFQFALLDGRTFRDNHGSTFLGEEQEAWLYSKISHSSDPIWLMSGSQFFGGYKSDDSFEATCPIDLQKNIDALAQLPASVILCSGDVHYSEVMKLEADLLGYESLEITSSSLHSPPTSGTGNNPRRLMKTTKDNFTLIEAHRTSNGTRGSISAYSAKPEPLYTYNFLVEK